jgi:hypothetical protein
MSVAMTRPVLREPLRHRAVAGTDLQAMPTGGNARLQQVKLARRVEQVRHQPQPVGFAPKIMLPHIFGHYFGRDNLSAVITLSFRRRRIKPGKKMVCGFIISKGRFRHFKVSAPAEMRPNAN